MDSRDAFNALVKEYPDFLLLSDFYYDEDGDLLFCVEMYHFAEYIWDKSNEMDFDFNPLKALLAEFIRIGDEKVKYSVVACLIDHLDALDTQSCNHTKTTQWLENLYPYLSENNNF